jgi:hypothetical protein
MFNDRPIEEIAEIIFNMDPDRVKRAEELKAQGVIEASKTITRKRLEDRKFERLLNQIENDEYSFDKPLMDREYFNGIRK